MAEGDSLETGTPEGQVGAGTDGSQTTQSAPASGEGQSSQATGEGQPGGDGTGTISDDTFFDPRELDPALIPAYKNMQRAFSKRMEKLSGNQQKIDAYDAFNSDPIGTMDPIFRQMGYQLVKAGGQQAQGNDVENWEPQNWGDVTSKITDAVMQKLQPFFGEFQGMKKTAIEQQLSEIDPGWQQYEDEMKQILNVHPTLARDPAKLYRLSIPENVLESRATQKALKKFEDKAKSSNISGSSSTPKTKGMEIPDKPMTFQEAVEFAKKKVAEDGFHPPGR